MRKSLLVGIVLLLSFALFAQGGSETTTASGAPKVHEWKWSISEPESHPWSQISYKMAEEIEKKTNGSITIKVYPGNTLGTQAEVLDMLRTGSLAMETTGPSILGTFYDPIQVWSLPYAFDNAAQAYAFYDSPSGQDMFNNVILNKTGVRTLDVWYYGDRDLTTKGLAVHSPSDLKGKAVRCMDTPIAKTVISALGGSPVPLNMSELYLALQTGTVVGQENPVPTIIAQKFYEVQDYLILTRHSVHMGTIHVSEQLWKQLSDDERKIVKEVFAEYRPLVEKEINKSTEEGLKFLKEHGMTIIDPDLEPFKANAQKVVEANFGKDAEWMKRINELNAFKKEYNSKH